MASSRLFVGYQRGVGGLKGADVLAAKLDRLSDAARETLRGALDKSADELVDGIKAIVPVGHGLEQHPGELRDSVHKEDGRNALSVYVTEDAKAADGEFYGPHVEFGHKTADGAHVPAYPHFFPEVRVSKRKMKSRISRAMTQAIRQTLAGDSSAGE